MRKTAAQHAAQGLVNLLIRRVRLRVQQSFRCKDDAAQAEATLRRLFVDKRLLDRMRFFRGSEPIQRGDVSATHRAHGRPAGPHGPPVHDGRTRPALTQSAAAIDDYAERSEQTVTAWQGMNGQQAGDPAKLAKALITIIGEDEPPLRWVAGADAVEAAEQKANALLAQIDAYRSLSIDLAHDDVRATV